MNVTHAIFTKYAPLSKINLGLIMGRRGGGGGGGGDCIVETALEVGGVTICTMRENRNISFKKIYDQKARKHMQNGTRTLWEQCIVVLYLPTCMYIMLHV